jgi:hypothetical protein
MIHAIRRMVKVKLGGRIEIPVSELNEGMDTEVIVLVQESKLTKAEGLPIQDEISRIQALVRQHVLEGSSLSEELIRERRAVEENPWAEFIGMFEGDAEFAEMATQWRKA